MTANPTAAAASPSPTPARNRTIVLVGMMGAGKTAIGRRLARALDLPFADADAEIETAAGTSIANIFAEIGEPEFRRRESQVIRRLLQGDAKVLALGGGAFIDPATRALIKDRAVSIWLRAEIDVLVQRTGRRHDRPLLEGVDRRHKLLTLLGERESIYAEADLTIDSDRGPVRTIVDEIVRRLPGEGGPGR